MSGTTEELGDWAVDQEVGAAYLKLSTNPVARTVEVDEDIYVDLDEFGVACGVELLDLEKPLPLDQLANQFHITLQLPSGGRRD